MTNIDTEKRYDRQLRLWASSGQSNLESSHVCLINATPAGLETLKSLVLPGIGQFTIVDDSIVSQDSVKDQFFLSKSDIGTKTAQAATARLLELNSEVKGNYELRSIEQIFQDDYNYWNKFRVVVVCEYLKNLEKLKFILWEKNIPLMLVNTLGFYCSLNVISKETTVVETHDPSNLMDLRIDKPWKDLKDLVDSIDFRALDDTNHAHVPYIIILIKALLHWKKTHDGLAPQNYSEKKLFRASIEVMSRNINVEANFIEAAESVNKSLQVTEVPSNVLQLFDNHILSDDNLSVQTPIFWSFVKALKNFVRKNNNQLPLSGSLPDMASDTESYIALKTLYNNQARIDRQKFKNELASVLESVGLSIDIITNQAIESFCKNSRFLYHTSGSESLYTSRLIEELYSDYTEGNTKTSSSLAIYFTILTFNKFIDEFQKMPKTEDIKSFTDIFLANFPSKTGNIPQHIDFTIKESLSHASKSYYNISSFVGGIASQEVLKFATSQYIPLDNLIVYDGIRSVSNRWKI